MTKYIIVNTKSNEIIVEGNALEYVSLIFKQIFTKDTRFKLYEKRYTYNGKTFSLKEIEVENNETKRITLRNNK